MKIFLGFLKEQTGSYDAVFIFSSVFLFIAALMVVPIFAGKSHCKKSKESRSSEQTENSTSTKTETIQTRHENSI